MIALKCIKSGWAGNRQIRLSARAASRPRMHSSSSHRRRHGGRGSARRFLTGGHRSINGDQRLPRAGHRQRDWLVGTMHHARHDGRPVRIRGCPALPPAASPPLLGRRGAPLACTGGAAMAGRGGRLKLDEASRPRRADAPVTMVIHPVPVLPRVPGQDLRAAEEELHRHRQGALHRA
jgi:hypothetical protein